MTGWKIHISIGYVHLQIPSCSIVMFVFWGVTSAKIYLGKIPHNVFFGLLQISSKRNHKCTTNSSCCSPCRNIKSKHPGTFLPYSARDPSGLQLSAHPWPHRIISCRKIQIFHNLGSCDQLAIGVEHIGTTWGWQCPFFPCLIHA